MVQRLQGLLDSQRANCTITGYSRKGRCSVLIKEERTFCLIQQSKAGKEQTPSSKQYAHFCNSYFPAWLPQLYRSSNSISTLLSMCKTLPRVCTTQTGYTGLSARENPALCTYCFLPDPACVSTQTHKQLAERKTPLCSCQVWMSEQLLRGWSQACWSQQYKFLCFQGGLWWSHAEEEIPGGSFTARPTGEHEVISRSISVSLLGNALIKAVFTNGISQ